MKKSKTAQERIDEMRRPPSLPNWVRLNEPRRDQTALRVARFVLAKPRHALGKVYRLLADYVTLGAQSTDIRTGIDLIDDPLVCQLGHEIATALLPWFDKHQIRGLAVFDGMFERFPIGRNIFIPVKPTFVFMRSGLPVPVFVIGWTGRNALTSFQKRLLATMIYKAILTQEDFQGSDALILFTPRHQYSKTSRDVRGMWVSKAALLTDDELYAQFDRYGESLEEALEIVKKALAGKPE